MFTRLLAPVVNPVLSALHVSDDRRANPHTHRRPYSRGHGGGIFSPNPTTGGILLGVAIAAAAVGGGYLLHRELMGGKDPNKLTPPPPDPDIALEEHIKPGATLGESPEIMEEIVQPIYLATYDAPDPDEFAARVSEIGVLTNTTITALDRVIFGMDTSLSEKSNTWIGWQGDQQLTGQKSPKAAALLVTNVTPEFMKVAWDWALYYIKADNSNWNTDAARDATVSKILTAMAPELDWSQGLQPYNAASAAWTAWTAVKLLAHVAYQSLVNSSGLEGVEIPGVVVPPPLPDDGFWPHSGPGGGPNQFG